MRAPAAAEAPTAISPWGFVLVRSAAVLAVEVLEAAEDDNGLRWRDTLWLLRRAQTLVAKSEAPLSPEAVRAARTIKAAVRVIESRLFGGEACQSQ